MMPGQRPSHHKGQVDYQTNATLFTPFVSPVANLDQRSVNFGFSRVVISVCRQKHLWTQLARPTTNQWDEISATSEAAILVVYEKASTVLP